QSGADGGGQPQNKGDGAAREVSRPAFQRPGHFVDCSRNVQRVGHGTMDARPVGWGCNEGVYAALVTATGFKPGVASAKAPGGFDSHPLPSNTEKPRCSQAFVCLRSAESGDFLSW